MGSILYRLDWPTNKMKEEKAEYLDRVSRNVNKWSISGYRTEGDSHSQEQVK